MLFRRQEKKGKILHGYRKKYGLSKILSFFFSSLNLASVYNSFPRKKIITIDGLPKEADSKMEIRVQ